MAGTNDIQFSLSLKNEASASLQQFKNDAESAMQAATKAAGKYGDTTKSLTQWIKEERLEQRQHNFIFAQTKEVVAGASSVLALYGNTLGQTSESQKLLTNSMNAGFVAFQGVNNVIGLLSGSLSFLSGPWGIAISLTAAAAVAFSQFNGEADKANDKIKSLAAEANELDYQLGRVSDSARKAFLVSEIVKAQEKVDALKSTTTDWVATLAAQGRQGLVQKLVGTPAEIDAAENAVRKTEQTFKSFFDTMQKQNAGGQKSVIAKMKEELDALRPGTKEYEDKLFNLRSAQMEYNAAVDQSATAVTERLLPATVKISSSMATVQAQVKGSMVAFKNYAIEIKRTSSDIAKSLEADQQALIDSVMGFAFSAANVVQSITGPVKEMIAGLFNNGEAVGKNFFKAIAQNFISLAQTAIAAYTAIGIAMGIPTFGASIPVSLAIAAGATAALEVANQVISRFHDGGTMAADGSRIPLQSDERHAILKVGETVLPTKPGESIGGGTVHNHFHFSGANIASPLAFKEVVEQGMRMMGVTDVSKYFVNQRNSLSIA